MPKTKEKVRAENARYRKEHPDVVKRAKRAWSKAHPDKVKEYKKRCIQKDPEKWSMRNKKYQASYRKNHPTDLEKAWEKRIRYLYGITKKMYDDLLLKQNGVCAICHKKCATGRRLSVDHEHKTKKVRGLLCSKCNEGLGLFEDDPLLLHTAASYLERRA